LCAGIISLAELRERITIQTGSEERRTVREFGEEGGGLKQKTGLPVKPRAGHDIVNMQKSFETESGVHRDW
jgi:hypothetical protein